MPGQSRDLQGSEETESFIEKVHDTVTTGSQGVHFKFCSPVQAKAVDCVATVPTYLRVSTFVGRRG